jgi:DNA-binding response OmpR family regulator
VKEGILLVKSVDDTFQQPLLETAGYQVQITTPDDALSSLNEGAFRLVLITTESSVPRTLDLCGQIKSTYPNLRIGLLAQRAEYIPKHECIDAIIRTQYSPNKFLATIRHLMDGQLAEGAMVPDEEDD